MILPRRQEPAAVHLDLVRGVAALLVLFGHVRNLLVTSATETAGRLSWDQKAFYLLTKQGQPAVCVFFVLSGFLIGTSVVSQLGNAKWDWRRYAVARLTRLWVVLVPALLLGFVLGRLGQETFSSSMVYTMPRYGMLMPRNLSAVLSLPTFLGNMLFVQTVYVAPLGSNGPLWSLANEFWYYVTFPATMLVVWKGIQPTARLIGLFVSTTVVVLMPADMRYLFLVWLMGALLAFVPRIDVPSPIRWACGLVLASYLGATSIMTVPHSRLFLGLLTTAFIYTLLTATKPVGPRQAAVSTRLSEISYSLYLSHMPFAALVTACLVGRSRFAPDALGMAVTLGVSTLALAYSTVLWWLFEKHTDSIRIWINRYLLPCVPESK